MCFARCGRGWALARCGDAERAIADLSTGTGGIWQLGVQTWLPYCLGLHAESALALGDLDRAERALDDALEICRISIDRCQEPELLHLRGRLIPASLPLASSSPSCRPARCEAARPKRACVGAPDWSSGGPCLIAVIPPIDDAADMGWTGSAAVHATLLRRPSHPIFHIASRAPRECRFILSETRSAT